MTVTTFRIEPSLMKRLRAKAKEDGCSLNYLVNKALKAAFPK